MWRVFEQSKSKFGKTEAVATARSEEQLPINELNACEAVLHELTLN
jgi:hypothetical protein